MADQFILLEKPQRAVQVGANRKGVTMGLPLVQVDDPLENAVELQGVVGRTVLGDIRLLVAHEHDVHAHLGGIDRHVHAARRLPGFVGRNVLPVLHAQPGGLGPDDALKLLLFLRRVDDAVDEQHVPYVPFVLDVQFAGLGLLQFVRDLELRLLQLGTEILQGVRLDAEVRLVLDEAAKVRVRKRLLQKPPSLRVVDLALDDQRFTDLRDVHAPHVLQFRLEVPHGLQKVPADRHLVCLPKLPRAKKLQGRRPFCEPRHARRASPRRNAHFKDALLRLD